MLNKNYKLGSSWKIAMLIPFAAIAFFFVSCTEKDAIAEDIQTEEPSIAEMEVFYVVEEMPTFNGGEAGPEFRRYIAQNLRYPKEAIEAGATGKIIIKFVVNKEGKIIIPDQETVAKIEGKPMGEVVVAAYRTLEEDDSAPDEKYINLLKEEVNRVVSGSPNWTPGKQRGKSVNVMYTFPVTFALQ